ncbi:unnamed protein product [Wickerhamomyces anomalus]
MSDVKKRGTIYQLRPDPPCECSPEQDAFTAAKLMFDNGVHCVLVKEQDTLVGLFTAKDLALRVVGKNLDPKLTKVKDIMTTSPLCLHMNTPTTDALETMVKKSVRHLPLLDDDNNIKGVLDITRCFHQAMLRLEKISLNAQKVNEVLRDVAENYEDIRTSKAQTIIDDIKKLMKLIEVPTLHSIVQVSKPAVYINSSASVRSASRLMIENSTTAVLVNDDTSSTRRVIGIFTSKDITFRVLAKAYDPDTCTVARVLTSSPEFAKMTDVVTGEIIGIVGVLQLTYAALSQLGKRDNIDKESFGKTMLEEVTNRLTDEETPAWESFWDSLDKSTDDIQVLESSVTGKTTSPVLSRSQTPRLSRHTSLNQLIMASGSRRTSFNRRVSEDLESLNQFKRTHSSEYLARTDLLIKRRTIVFKIKPSNSSRNHKISVTITDGALLNNELKLFELIRNELSEKIEIEASNQILLFHNDEGNLIEITNDFELSEAITETEAKNAKYVELLVKDRSNGWISSLLSFFSTVRLKARELFYESSTLSGAIAILSAGIILGYTISKK